MSRFGLIGPSYQSQSPNLDAEFCINWYPEVDDGGAGNAPIAMYPTPGTKSFVNLNIGSGGGSAPGLDQVVQASQTGSPLSLAYGPFHPISPNEIVLASIMTNTVLSIAPNGAQVGVAGYLWSSTLTVNPTTYTATFGSGTPAAIVAASFFGTALAVAQSGTSATLTKSFVNPVPVGHTIVVSLAVSTIQTAPGTYTVTDDKGNVYTQVGLQNVVSGVNFGQAGLWVCQNPSGGPQAILITKNTGGVIFSSQMSIADVSGLALNPPANGPIRGELFINGRAFVVSGGGFFEIFANGTFTLWGAVANDALPVTMAASPQQLLLASAGTAYVFDLMANTLTAIPGATFSGPVAQAAICDDFFILTIQNSKEFAVSAPLDATDWVTNGTAIVSVFPDNIVSMLVFQRQVWFFSDTQSVVYYDSGNIFPFDVNPNAFIEAGSAAENSPAIFNNSIAWLGADARGRGKVWLASGYTPTRISNHAIEFAIQSYSRIDDAVGFSMQDQGHEFYALYFPTPSVMWLYDAMTGMWHQRGFWVESIGQFRAAHYQNHMSAFGRHLVGDWQSANVYELKIPTLLPGGAWDFATDAGNPIRRVRRAPHVSKEQKRQFHIELQVYLESGLGPTPPLGTTANLADTFVRANENPLNPAIWQLATNPPFGNWAHLQIVGNAAQSAMDGSAGETEGVESYQGTVFPPDQTAEIKIIALTNGASAGIVLRGDITTWFSYEMFVSDVGGGLCQIEIDLWNGVGLPPAVLFLGAPFAFVPGDTYKFEAKGSTLSFYRNNALIGAVNDHTHQNSGFIAIDLLPIIASADVRVTNFTASAQTIRQPQIMLRWSDDGGHTWSNEYARDCGMAGEFKKRVRWLQLGRARDRVYEISASDPIPWRIVDGYLQVVAGTGI